MAKKFWKYFLNKKEFCLFNIYNDTGAEWKKAYNNTLTPIEQERLKKMYDAAEGEDKKILERVLRKYGAYKLEL